MDKQKSNAFMMKLVGDVATSFASALIWVGLDTGLFKAMAGAGPLTADALGERAGILPRYAAEWLAAMAGAGVVAYDAAADAFVLPDEHALFLTDASSEYFLGGLFTGLPGLMNMAPRLAEAFRQGEGISFAEFGAGLPQALEAMNRPVYEKRLVSHWLATLPDVVARLAAGGRALDIGCGTGVVPVTLAKAFPQAEVAGLDLDAGSIAMARLQAEEAGVGDRVQFLSVPAAELPRAPGWDLITTFDVVHDLPDPAGVLRDIRAALAEGGTYLMVEPAVADGLADNLGNPFARMLYGISCLHCVPQSIAQGGPGLGACWGEGKARVMALDAGFEKFERLPVRSPVMAFYALSG